MSLYIGIDLGTSSVKLLAIDEQGTPVYQCQRDYTVDEPKPGFKEIDPIDWIDAVEDGLIELLGALDRTRIKGIGVTGQMHTVLFLDEEGRSIRPALMWNDTRTKTCVETLKAAVQDAEDTEMICEILSTGSPAANLYWLKQNEPENFERMQHFVIGPDYIVHYLTGKISTDYCEASTSSLYDIKTKKWSETMKKTIGIKKEAYPEVFGSHEIVGTITQELSEKFKLNPDTYVIAGTGDNPAAAVATGCLKGGFPVLSLGTSGVLMIRKETLEQGAKGKNILFSADNKQIDYLVQGVVQSAGSSYHWMVKTILQSDDFSSELSGIEVDKLGNNELLFYPHLVGDKTIYKDPLLRGAMMGVGTDTTRQDLIIAVMEGIAFAVKELTEVMQLSEHWETIKVTGGGAKSDVWMQILANVLDKNIQQMEGNEGAALGVSMLARDANQKAPMDQAKERQTQVKKLYRPVVNNVQWYQEKYQKYRKMYRAIKSVYG